MRFTLLRSSRPLRNGNRNVRLSKFPLRASHQEAARKMTSQKFLRWFASDWRDNARLIIETIGIIVICLTLWYTAKSVTAATESVVQAKASVDAALVQVDQGKYQAVYEQQLDLWRLAVEHPDVAKYIIGGSGPEPNIEAAESITLDFYAYVYAQLAPLDENNRPVGLALDGSNVNQPKNISDAEWVGWKSWSYTIAYGFQGVPSLCQQLRDNVDAYDIYFRAAIEEARLCVLGP